MSWGTCWLHVTVNTRRRNLVSKVHDRTRKTLYINKTNNFQFVSVCNYAVVYVATETSERITVISALLPQSCCAMYVNSVALWRLCVNSAIASTFRVPGAYVYSNMVAEGSNYGGICLCHRQGCHAAGPADHRTSDSINNLRVIGPSSSLSLWSCRRAHVILDITAARRYLLYLFTVSYSNQLQM